MRYILLFVMFNKISPNGLCYILLRLDDIYSHFDPCNYFCSHSMAGKCMENFGIFILLSNISNPGILSI